MKHAAANGGGPEGTPPKRLRYPSVMVSFVTEAGGNW